ncbi:spore germination protein [Scopulibacillus darangshiensis]|uniref:Spore germination protein n=1 Tax=Scopulibacillus darangshiensis TaxID=442528 RepID=A0A4R2P9G1_9BACL|nr:germination protein YpeB [Scopulibacillus darangshiensis]TCP31663.1 spore germination protein [Scopulibacillus darangshiensis]
MIRSVIIGILAVAVVGVGYWGYQEHKEKNAVLIHAENNYQQSYHELTYYVDQLQNKIGTTLAMNSRKSMRPELADVWRLSALAHGAVGELPLTLLPFNKTNEFLTNVGKYSYQTGVKDKGDSALSKQEYNTLENLYKQSTDVEKGLRKVQNVVMQNHLRWMDVELALSSQKQKNDNQVIDGLKTVDGKAETFSEQWGPEMNQLNTDEEKKFKKISGKPVDKNTAVLRLKHFLNLNNTDTISIQKTGKGSNYPAYNMTVKDKKTDNSIVASVTKKGGHVIWFIKNRPVKYDKLSLHEASQKAESFLKKHDFKNMTMVKSDQYQNIGVFTYVKKVGDVRVYPASLRVKVALDNGEIIALDETDYLINRSIDIDMTPKISKSEALKDLNSNIKVQETHLAIFQNESGNNILCYELLATKGNDTYRIFINANDGTQENVELLTD